VITMTRVLDYFSTLVAEDESLPLTEAALSLAQDAYPDLDLQGTLAEIDELVLHVLKTDGEPEERVKRELDLLFTARTEIHPNRVVCHTEEEMRELQGVGTQLKEMRIVDHRPMNGHTASPAAMASLSHGSESVTAGGSHE